jgi:hypothetical protein
MADSGSDLLIGSDGEDHMLGGDGYDTISEQLRRLRGVSNMNEDESKSGSGAAVVVVVVVLLFAVVCGGGIVLLGGYFMLRVQAPAPMALPPVPGANAPVPGPTLAIPDNSSINVNNLKSSQNLFDAAAEVLTLAKYEQIKPGMTYDELVAVLAIPDNKRPADIELVGPESDVELKWFGGPDDALSITVKMKGKVVTDKSQTGLQ